MRIQAYPLLAFLVVGILLLNGCATVPDPVTPTAAQEVATRAPDQQPTADPEPTLSPHPGWTTYSNPTFGISFRYPSTWYGPDVYEFEDGVRLAVGSDTVYPYGTGPEDRQPGAPNAYAIVIQYTLSPTGRTLEQARAEQPWINDTLAVLDMQDGESSTTARSMTTRVRALTLGRFTGVEFTTTLSETAQTERFFMRSAFLMDDELNVLLITGSPDNVEVTDPATWRQAFEAVDESNRETLYDLIDSIQVN